MINTTNGILIYIGYEDMPWLYIEYKWNFCDCNYILWWSSYKYMCKTDEYHAIIIIINKIDIIIKAIDASVVIFTIIHKILWLDIVIQGRKLQILAYVFMLPFDFMKHKLAWQNVLLFHLIAWQKMSLIPLYL